MTREIAHFQQFAAALTTLSPNFPPGVLQGDPRSSHAYFNMSNGADVRGPWNQGQGPWPAGESWEYIADSLQEVMQTQGQRTKPIQGTNRTFEMVQQLNQQVGQMRSQEVKSASPPGPSAWSTYGQQTAASATAATMPAPGDTPMTAAHRRGEGA